MRTIPIAKQYQDHDDWCWAAVGSILYEHCTGRRLSQCEVAGRLLNGDCCTQSADCKVPAPLGDLLVKLNCLRPGGQLARPLSLEAICDELERRRRVVAVRIARPGSIVGHFLIVNGYDTTSSPGHLLIFDPRLREALIPFDQFPEAHIAGTQWTHSYLLEAAT